MNFSKLLLKITEKWPVKALSVAAALIISVFYRLSTLDNRNFSIPLKVETANNFITLDPIVETVRVTIRGESNILLNITENDIEAYIDLNRYSKEGTYKIPIQIRKRGNAIGIEPLEISVSPMEIQITMEEKISRFVHIFPSFTGRTASGYEMTEQTVTPDSVIVEGPRSMIDELKEFITETIELDDRNRDFTILVPIKNDNPNITVYGNKLIEVSCTISRIVTDPIIYYIEPDDTLNEAFEIEDGETSE